MKKRIEKLAKGEVYFDKPVLHISETKINQEIPTGTIYHGSFVLQGEESLQGFVYSSNSRVTVFQTDFSAVRTEVTYQVDLNGMQPQEKAEGIFTIVCTAGEFQVPYTFINAYRSLETSLGKVSNLFHFANLVQKAPEEAQKIFVQEDFADIFIRNDLNVRNIYTVLVREKNVRKAMEQFLIAVKKKSPVRLQLEQDKKKYEDFSDAFSDTIQITSSTWGYLEFELEADADFIQLEKTHVTTEQFSGNTFVLSYVLDKSRMHIGHNFGRIRIKTPVQQLEFSIEADSYSVGILDKRQYRDPHRLEKQKLLSQVIRGYLDFRLGTIKAQDWAEKMHKILTRCISLEEDNLVWKLFDAQVYLAQGRRENCKWLLDHVKDQVMSNMCSDAKLYCYYMYVDSLYKKDPQTSRNIVKILRKHYENGDDYWQILWMLFYTDEEFDRNASIKLARIKAQFHRGCNSPVMYFEACQIFNAQPMLLRVLNGFEMQVIHFGCKNNLITEKLATQIAELFANAKTVTRPQLKILHLIYEKYESDKMLNLLCTCMIRDELYGKQYFSIYDKSIQKGLRITRLYEFYMMSVDEAKMEPLPKIVLMYFAYNSQLSFEKKAYLYANIITNREKDEQTYASYHKQIELFALDQLHKGRKSEHLGIIYRDVWDRSLINGDSADAIADITFSARIVCEDPDQKYCVVKHKENVTIRRIPLEDGQAFIPFYTENVFLAFENTKGEYSVDVAYSVTPMFEDRSFVQMLFDCNRNHLYLAMYLCEKNFSYQKSFCYQGAVQKLLLDNKEIEKCYKQEIIHHIIEYYADGEHMQEFVQRFAQLDSSALTGDDAAKLTELCIANEMYEEAYDLVISYGFEKIPPKKVMRLAGKMIDQLEGNYNYLVMQMCYFAFVHNKYDAKLLAYLAEGYNDSTIVMKTILSKAADYEIPVSDLLERVLAQLLFTGEKPEQITGIFHTYYVQGGREELINACLTYCSYQYFVKAEQPDEKMMQILEEKISYKEELPVVCRFAWLRFQAEKKEITPELKKLMEEEIEQLVRNGYLFRFFELLKGRIRMPVTLSGKTMIEYRTRPKTEVTISYQIDDNGEETRKNMPEIFEGIHVEAVSLFYGEECSYHIIDEAAEESEQKKEYRIVCNNVEQNEIPDRYDYINDMLASSEMDDIQTLKKLMHGYCVQDYVVGNIFKPM